MAIQSRDILTGPVDITMITLTYFIVDGVTSMRRPECVAVMSGGFSGAGLLKVFRPPIPIILNLSGWTLVSEPKYWSVAAQVSDSLVLGRLEAI